MVITSRAHLLTLCAMLSLPPLGGTLADPAIKSAIVGLISTGSPDNTLELNPLNNYKGIFGGLVVQAYWRDLQPNSSSDFDTTVIDGALAVVGTYNAAAALLPPPNNRQIGVRLRVFAGCTDGISDAPAWAMSLDGNPITINAYYAGAPETCTTGRFWDPTSRYAAAWKQLQTQLATKYDTNSLIQEVAVTSCTSFSAEPFFLPYSDAGDTTTTVLQAAGYNDASYQQCLENAVDDYAPWQTTRLEFTFNPFNGLTSPPQGDVAFSERVMRGCRQTAGQRCILSNHDLDTNPPTPGGILPLYALMRKLGPNITFQTYLVNPNDFEGTLRKGISLGAGSIEVWQEPAGFEAQSNATLQNWASMFEPH
jgi:hypothetical protein